MFLQQFPRGIAVLGGDGQEEMFGGNILVLELGGLFERALQNVVQGTPQVLLRKSLNFRQVPDFTFDVLGEYLRPDAETREQRRHHTILLLRESGKKMHRFNRLILVAGGNFMSCLDGLLGLHGHFVESQHSALSNPILYSEGGRLRSQPPHAIAQRLAPSARFADYLPAATATAEPSTFTLICFGLASSRFGMLSVSTPFLYSALIASVFTVFASEKLRVNDP